MHGFVLRNRKARWAAAATMFVIVSCAGPQYDSQTDKLISQLQTGIDTEIVFLITLDHKIDLLSGQNDPASRRALADAKTKASYDANTGFYDKVDVDLTGLQTRVDAQPSLATPYIDNSIAALRANLLSDDGSMQATHQKVQILSVPYLMTVRQLVDAQIGALLTRELALKSGGSESVPGLADEAVKPTQTH